MLLACLCSTALLKANNINKSESMPTAAEYSQSCPRPQLAEQRVNFVVPEVSVSLFFFNFWKDLSGEFVLLKKIIKATYMKTLPALL